MEHRPSTETAVEAAVLEEANALLSKKWSVAVLRELFRNGPQGFSELETGIEAVSDKVLSGCLDSLQENGLIERRVLQEEPLRVEYVLTDRGSDLGPVVDQLESWAATHLLAETETVLLADDDERLVEMHATWLAESFELRTATGGIDAREQLDEGVDVLVTDRRMPELSGEQLTEYARASELGCGVVLLSSTDLDEEVLELQFDAYVRKPTTPDALQEAIETALAGRAESPRKREFQSLKARLSLCASSFSRERRQESPRYQELVERAITLGETLDRTDELPIEYIDS